MSLTNAKNIQNNCVLNLGIKNEFILPSCPLGLNWITPIADVQAQCTGHILDLVISRWDELHIYSSTISASCFLQMFPSHLSARSHLYVASSKIFVKTHSRLV